MENEIEQPVDSNVAARNAKLADLITQFPKLLTAAQKLNEAQIEWHIGGSACLYVLGNARVPQNVDIYIADEDHDRVDALFGVTSHEYEWEHHSARNSTPYAFGHALRLISQLQFNLLGGQYHYRITDITRTHKIHLTDQGVDFYLAPPEDVLLIKSLQFYSDPAVRNHHGADIAQFKKVYALDQHYSEAKSAEIGISVQDGVLVPNAPLGPKQ